LTRAAQPDDLSSFKGETGLFNKTLKHFFWNTWDNILRVLGLSMLGSFLNLPLILGVVLLWGAAKLTPDQLLVNPEGPAAVSTMASTTAGAAPATAGAAPATAGAAPATAGAAPATGKTEAVPEDAVAGTVPLPGGTTGTATNQNPVPARMESSQAYDVFANLALALLLGITFPAMAAVFASARNLIEGTAGGFFRDFFHNLVSCFPRALLLFLASGAIWVLLLIALKFYLYHPLFESMPALQYAAIGVTAWFFLFFSLIQLYLVPLLVTRKEGIGMLFKRAALLVVDNIGQSITVLVTSAVLFALSLFSVVVITLLLPGVLAMLWMTNYFMLLRQYEPPEEKPDANQPRKRDFSAENETRSWRTIFRPWEG
jgi:uncharacterized membrane protein YesL